MARRAPAARGLRQACPAQDCDPQAVATSDGHEQVFVDDNGVIKQNWFAPNGDAIGNWVTI